MNRTIFYVSALFLLTIFVSGYALIRNKITQQIRTISRENLLIADNIARSIEEIIRQNRTHLESVERGVAPRNSLQVLDIFDALYVVNFTAESEEVLFGDDGLTGEGLNALHLQLEENRLNSYASRYGEKRAVVVGVPSITQRTGADEYILGVISIDRFSRVAERLLRRRGGGEWSFVSRKSDLLASSDGFGISDHTSLVTGSVASISRDPDVIYAHILNMGKDIEGGLVRGSTGKWIMSTVFVSGTNFAVNVFQPESLATAGVNSYVLKVSLAFLFVLVVVAIIGRYEFQRTRRPIRKFVSMARDLLQEKAISQRKPDIHTLEDVFDRIADKIQQSRYDRIKSNIQLLNLNELNKILLSSVDLRQMLDTISHYIIKEFGFTFVFLGLIDKENAMIIGEILSHEGEKASDLLISMDDESSLAVKTILEGRTIRSSAPGVKQLLGEKTEMTGDFSISHFILLPIVAQKGVSVCWLRKRCEKVSCEKYGQRETKCWEQTTDSREEGGSFSMLRPRKQKCYCCDLYPVLGVIAVNLAPQDMEENSNRLLFIKTIVNQIGILLENAILVNNLQHIEKFREDVMNSMSSGLIMVDMDGRIMDVNLAAEKILARQRVDMLGEDLNSLLHFENGDSNPILKTLQDGKPFAGYETRIKRDGRGVANISISTSFLSDQHGDVYGIIGELKDTTYLRKIENEVIHLEKLAAIGRLTTSIAHEIRNPIAGISAGIQYLETNLVENSPHSETISFIKREIERLDRIIVDLYTISRPSQYEFKRYPIMNLIAETLMNVEAEANARGIHLVYREEASNLMDPYIDRDKIKQVLLNLLKNAIHASDENSVISVLVDEFYSDDGDETEGEPEGEPAGIILKVKDQGAGIEPEDLEKIFEPFFSKKKDGTGLGLYICYSIMESHKGHIQVESTPGEGTTVTLKLLGEDTFKEKF
jgi:PAS domain S-box-containing protein